MSNFTPLVKREFDFQGDTVKVSYSRLKRLDMLKVLPVMQKLGNPENPNQDAVQEILELLIESLPGYVKDFSGLVDSEGQSIEIQAVVDEFYFMPLAAQIAVQMITDSSATEGKV